MPKMISRELRESAIQRAIAGEATDKIASEIGCHPATITGWVRKHNAPSQEAPAAGAGAKGAGALLATASAPPAQPPPTADELLATVEALRVTTLSAIARAKDLDPAHKMVADIIAIPKNEKDVLRTLAPQAAKFAPGVLEKMPMIAGISFLVVYTLSGWSAMRALSKLEEKAKDLLGEKIAEEMRKEQAARAAGVAA